MAPGITVRAAGVAVVLLVSGCGLAAGPAPSAPRPAAIVRAAAAAVAATPSPVTKVRRVSPLDGRGVLRPPFSVGASSRGYCWTTSFENGALFRCFRGNLIEDPCWKEAGRRSVVCLAVPWTTTVTRLRLTRRLPPAGSALPRLWALRLGGDVGVNCLASQGASGAVGKLGISYFCKRGWVLLGNGPDRSQPLWTMPTARRVAGEYRLRGAKPIPVAWKAVLR